MLKRLLIGTAGFGTIAGWLLLVSAAAPVLGHGIGGPWVQVPGSRVTPGQPFELWGADFGAHATVEVAVSDGEQVLPVGSVPAAADGHFTADLRLPSGAPDGYVELIAEDRRGGRATVWVFVGQEGEFTPPAVRRDWWADPSVIVLGLAVGGGLVGLGVLAFRRQRATQPRPAPADVRRQAPKRRRRSNRG